MKYVTHAGAWSNGEIAYLAWDVEGKITGALGFMITRVHETGADTGARRRLPTWVAFTDQSNPNWIAQDSSVWPIQAFEWRDLTLRRSRDKTQIRPIDFRVHYEIVPVGVEAEGRTAIAPSDTAHRLDRNGDLNYEGPQHPLFQIGEPTVTNSIDVTHTFGPNGEIAAAFNNGILSTQNLIQQLRSIGEAPAPKLLAAAASSDAKIRVKATREKQDGLLTILKRAIADPTSPIRDYLDGDVYEFVTRLLDRARADGGEVYLALYELQDKALIDTLVAAVKDGLAHVILSNTGSETPNAKNTPAADRKPAVWDTENTPARTALHAAAGRQKPQRVFDRMFCNSGHIGHNKFAVYVADGVAKAVMTGSTNWTNTGLCAQSNNSIVIENDALAGDYWDYWKALRDDPQPAREPYVATVLRGKTTVTLDGARPNNGVQASALRSADAAAPTERPLGDAGAATLWRSPNTAKPSVPARDPATPPDLQVVYDLMRAAKEAIFFLTFLPGVSGKNNIIGVAADIAVAKNGPLVVGAVSDPKAMPNYDAKDAATYVDTKGKTKPLPPPAIWWPGGDTSRIAMIRAAAVRVPFGNFQPELLTAGHAIIHDKIIVIDPCNAQNCTVITGSHNLGFKASYANDDNMLITRGNTALATAYAVHVLDVYDHYVFRARIEDDLRKQLREGKIHSYDQAASHADPRGLLPLDDSWQKEHFAKNRPATSLDYFLAHA
jgi:phosphatidylserine/phosphatidylglycerophosphate/cardiolipin synthase-like enzyme